MRCLTAGLMPAGYERRADLIPELTGELHYAIVGFLARTPSVLLLVNQEDLTMVKESAEPARHNGSVSELEPQNAVVDRRPQGTEGSAGLRGHGRLVDWNNRPRDAAAGKLIGSPPEEPDAGSGADQVAAR